MSSSEKRGAANNTWQNKFIKRELTGRRIDCDYVSSIWGSSQCLYQKDLLGHFNSVHAVEFSNDGKLLASGTKQLILSTSNCYIISHHITLSLTGGEDERVLLWKTSDIFNPKQRNRPQVINGNYMEEEVDSQIISLAFSNNGEKLLSSGRGGGVIFMHDIET